MTGWWCWDVPKEAVPFGTAVGVQLAAGVEIPRTGLASQVASAACAAAGRQRRCGDQRRGRQQHGSPTVCAAPARQCCAGPLDRGRRQVIDHGRSPIRPRRFDSHSLVQSLSPPRAAY